MRELLVLQKIFLYSLFFLMLFVLNSKKPCQVMEIRVQDFSCNGSMNENFFPDEKDTFLARFMANNEDQEYRQNGHAKI